MSEPRKRKPTAKRMPRFTIGTVDMVGKKGAGVITPWDRSEGEKVYFHIDDFADEIDTSAPEQLKGLIVQFVKEPTESGLRARKITILDRESR